jgi:hypothetical protein
MNEGWRNELAAWTQNVTPRIGPRLGAVMDCVRRSLLPTVARSAKVGPALRDPAGQLRCLPNPTRHELLIELVVLVDIEVAHFLVLGLAGEERTQ